MDTLRKLFVLSLVFIVLFSSTGTALGHPAGGHFMPDKVLFWQDCLVVQLDFLELMAPEITKEEEIDNVTIIEHVVESGDTIRSISREYGVRESTILNNNNIKNPNLIVIGQTLKFPSIDGLIHTIRRGDTIHGLAKTYNISVSDILDINDVEATELAIGSILLLPNAEPIVAKNTSISVSRSAPALSGLRNMLWPVQGVITSPYGWRRNPFNPSTRQFHRGLDIGANRGTTIVAATAGRVVHSGWINGYGKTVILAHGNLYTLYAHASSLSVQTGQWVNAGQEIARVGATGNATGPHLHFEVRVNGNSSSNTVNPINFLGR